MISLIVGIGKNNLIGKDNSLPWHIKEDLQHFKNYTTGKKVIMGYNTYLSIGKALPNRTNIVVNLDPIKLDDAIVENDLFKVLNEYKNTEEELVVIGGATIYKLALPYVDKMVVSKISGDYEGNVFFPEFEDKFDCYKEESISDKVTVCYYKRKA